MSKNELIDRLEQLSRFLVGFGEAAELVSKKLRELVDEVEKHGVDNDQY